MDREKEKLRKPELTAQENLTESPADPHDHHSSPPRLPLITAALQAASAPNASLVYVPDWGHWGGYNDRFAFGTYRGMEV
jgi:hypothetical protein